MYLKEDWSQSIRRNCAVEMSHVVAQTMIDQSSNRRVFRVSRRIRRILVRDILHDRDMLAKQKTVVIQNRYFMLRVQLKIDECCIVLFMYFVRGRSKLFYSSVIDAINNSFYMKLPIKPPDYHSSNSSIKHFLTFA